jgi:hypothetical protein
MTLWDWLHELSWWRFLLLVGLVMVLGELLIGAMILGVARVWTFFSGDEREW